MRAFVRPGVLLGSAENEPLWRGCGIRFRQPLPVGETGESECEWRTKGSRRARYKERVKRDA